MNIVIHGEMNYGYALTKDLQARCDKALELFNTPMRSWNDKIICSGGLFHPNQQGVPVSVAMKHYLEYIGCDVPIYTEKRSITSIHNIERVDAWKLPHAIVISSWYHIPRLWLIWKMSKTEVRFVGAPCSFTLKRFFLELLGIYTFILYALGFKSRELDFRKKRDVTNNKKTKRDREVYPELQSSSRL